MPWLRKRNWSFLLLNKHQLRKNLREQRRTILPDQRRLWAHATANLFVHHSLFQSCVRIGCYIARDDEFDCTPIIEKIWEQKKMCYLPALSSIRNNFLEFIRYHPNDALRPNRYQILEPEKKDSVSGDELDLVLVPLVGFDLQGNRLGMGGGYYDRTFEFLLERKEKARPLLIGLAYEMQRVDGLVRDSWDVSLDGVLTEEKFILFGKGVAT